MYEIVSSAKNTQLHSFPALEQLSVSPHLGNDGSVCQFFGVSQMFLRTNKNLGIELLRIKGKEISGVRKINIDNLYCVACPKTDREEVAIGFTSGMVRFMNLGKKVSYTKRFDADRMAVGVTFLDFNSADDLLAAVYENGRINVYGVKTSTKVQTIEFDKNTTKVRFHPTKRFQMAVASYNGNICLYDTQTKKTLFSQHTAHAAPCRDVAMTMHYPEFIFSVGYDNLINVFDTRRKGTASQLQSNYPFESLAVSECGNYFCAGNLKGEIYGYDLRKLQNPMAFKKVHESIVNSVVFVPPQTGERSRASMDVGSSGQEQTLAVSKTSSGTASTGSIATDRSSLSVNEDRKPAVPQMEADSFMSEIDMFLQRREPSMDCMSRFSTSSRQSTESRQSITNMGAGGGAKMMNFLNDSSDRSAEGVTAFGDLAEEGTEVSAVNESFINTNRLARRLRRDKSMQLGGRLDNLEYIREEESSVEGNRILTNSQQNNTSQPVNGLPKTKTPSLVEMTPSPDDDATDDNKENELVKPAQGDQLPKEAKLTEADSSMVTSTAPNDAPISENIQSVFRELRAEIADLRVEMRNQFHKFSLDQHHAIQGTRSYLSREMFNMYREMNKQIETLHDVSSNSFGLLLTSDPFTQRFLALEKENAVLKRRVEELQQRNSKDGGAR